MSKLTMDIVNYLEETHTVLITRESLETLKEKSNTLDKIRKQKTEMLYDIYMKCINMGGEYTGCWIRYRDVKNIINKYMGGNNE